MEDRTVAADGGAYSGWAKSMAVQDLITLAALASTKPDAASSQPLVTSDIMTKWAWESIQGSLSRVVESEKRRAT